NRNRIVDPERTGLHLFSFELQAPVDLTHAWRVHWTGSEADPSVPLRPGPYFHALATTLPLGVNIEDGDTVFRLFAPRAKRVTLCLRHVDTRDDVAAEEVALERRPAPADDGEAAVWEAVVEGNLHGW